MSDTSAREVATLGGGCFWCLEAVYDELRGVTDVVSGYAGGRRPNPSYEQVCTGATGHAEVIQVTFDPSQIAFRDLLQVFFTIHDPTTPNRQGNDVGTQYRSVIYYHSPEQLATSQEVIAELTADKVWDNKIVTELTPAPTFYAAEDYHQEYFKKNQNPSKPSYCSVIVAPKVVKARQKFAALMKA
ncbi:MAG: peptide-methionine (S)-S-oxide reductase MsrA [Chloroflexales bacterium]|nr:peptide-methionine (S)-S-oxide reductase MsrA [Chloroflexales bacterium]